MLTLLLRSQRFTNSPWPWATHFHALKKLTNKKEKFSPKTKRYLVMACDTLPLKKEKKPEEMQLPIVSPVPSHPAP